MRTINQLKDEMNSIQVDISTKDLKKMQITRLKKRFQFLKLCVSYMQSEPNKAFLVAEKDRLNNKINLIHQGYIPNAALLKNGLHKEEKAEHKDYNKIMGLNKWSEQLKSIKFLLS